MSNVYVNRTLLYVSSEMVELSGKQDEWNHPCSDDENYGVEGKDVWEPSATDIVALYELLDKEGIIDLEWQCPGRRVPSPAQDDFCQKDEECLESKPQEKSDFDFMDEMSTPKFTPRRTGEGGPKGSAKKKTTSLDGVLSNIRRHRILAEMEKQASESAAIAAAMSATTTTTITTTAAASSSTAATTTTSLNP